MQEHRKPPKKKEKSSKQAKKQRGKKKMGDPRKTRKQFKRPLKIWDKANLEKERALLQGYGLKNKREIWRIETMLRKKRHSARSLLALPLEERLKREKQLLQNCPVSGDRDIPGKLKRKLMYEVLRICGIKQ